MTDLPTQDEMSDTPLPWHLGDQRAIYAADSTYIVRMPTRELAEYVINAVNAFDRRNARQLSSRELIET